MEPARSESRPPPGRTRWITTGAAALALLAGGCADRTPTEPEVSPPVTVQPEAPRAFVSTIGAVLGTLSLPAASPPGELSPGGAAPAPSSMTFARSGWVRVRASGKVRFQALPGMDSYPCGTECLYPHAPFGPAGEVGPLGISNRLSLQVSVGNRQTQGRLWRPHPLPGDAAEDLVRVSAGEVLWLGRVPMEGWKSCHFCDPPAPQRPWYETTGQHQVEVTEVVPLQVEPAERGSSVGDRVTFRTQAIEGMGQYQWYYVYPARGMATRIDACRHQETCTIELEHPGYMQVYANWRGRPFTTADAKSPMAGICAAEAPSVLDADGPRLAAAGTEDACAPPVKLMLECTSTVGVNRVERGSELGCTVRKEPQSAAGLITVAGWSFNGVPRTDGDLTSLSWSGPMVIDGTIAVRARIDSEPEQTLTAVVDVEDRKWGRVQLEHPAHDSLAGHLPPMPSPDTSFFFGYRLDELADSHLERRVGHMPYAGRFAAVERGPNTHFWYVTQPLRRPYYLVHVSDAWHTSSPWYKKQHGPLPFCSKSDIRLLHRRAKLHEGLTQHPVSGDIYQPTMTHHAAARRFFRQQLDLNALYERQVRHMPPSPPDPKDYQQTFENHLDQIWVDSVQEPQTTYNVALVHTPQNLVPIHCKAR